MKDHPILMNCEMVRAILDGRKTQTRRPIKPQPPAGFIEPRQGHDGGWFAMDGRQGGMLDNYPLRSPFGKPGDALWIRETFAEGVVGCPGGLSYRADHLDPKGDGPANPMKWSPSIHMPRAASRITLTVKRVWVERVQDITEEGVVAEGVRVPHTLGESLMPDAMRERAWASARAEARRRFARRWDSVHAGKGLGWDTNPWVWACEFEVSE